MQEIAAYFRRFANPPEADIARFAALGKPRHLAPGQSFCDLGQERHELAFIRSGIVRYYVTLANGDEATKDFSFTGGFTVSFGSASMRRPAQVAIAAVVATDLLVWPYETLLALYETHPEWQKCGRRVAEMLYVRKEQRELSFLLADAKTRYGQLRGQFGSQIDQIPQYYLASYLGIRPQSLSRLRKRIGVNPGE